MEDLCKRFPHLSENILNQVNDQSLNNCKEISSELLQCLERGRFFWIRMIKKYQKDLKDFPKFWKPVVDKTPIEIVKQVAIAVSRFFQLPHLYSDLSELDLRGRRCRWSVFAICANYGDMALLHYVIDQIKLKNIRKTERVNALFLAAFQGHLEVYKLVMKNLKDKNPGNTSILNNTGITPLHYAAQNGHFSVCELITANTADKNPVTRYVNNRYQYGHNYGSTPLHFAAQNGHLEICKLLINNIVEKNPADHKEGYTPYHLAAEYGHTSICKYMWEHLPDKNPAIKERGKTALHCAAEKGHVEVCKLIMDDLVDNNINNPERTRNGSFFKHLLCPEDSHDKYRTPFHLAVMNGRYEVCQLFLETIGNRLIEGIYVPYEGTDHAWKREDAVRFVRESLLRGRSPYDMAEENGHHEICKLLNHYGSNWQIFHLSTKIIYAAGCGPSKQR